MHFLSCPYWMALSHMAVHILFIQCSVGKLLGCIHFLVITDVSTVDICIEMFCMHVHFHSLGCALTATAGSCGNSSRGRTSDCSPNATAPFYLPAIRVQGPWFPQVLAYTYLLALICSFLLADDIKHLSMCLVAICISSLVKDLYPLPVFKLGYLFLRWKSSLCVLETNSLSDVWFANFCLILWVIFSLPWCVLRSIKVLILMISSLSILSFVVYAFGVIFKKTLPSQGCEDLYYVFF